MAVTWLDTDALFPVVTERLLPSNVLLDIGCGIQPQRLVRPEVHICCEPFVQYVEKLQELVTHEPDRNFVVLNATWDQAVQLFPAKSVDTVMLNDVIEHLEKDEALRLLKATEPIARRQIAIFTPLGFMPQHHPNGIDAWGLGGGHWQEHRSGWQPEDFDDSWDIYVTKVYYLSDSMGNTLESPFGAMWAIKNLVSSEAKAPFKRSNRQRVYAVVDKVLRTIWAINDLLQRKP